mmetsp:Transcript_4207/g.4316  ORF Transcript_4207/g.4316 Transcript_4207/m.4316 type:complete len:282 (-) Transcript_4207:252-1097(-)|eukprot:CAMPEP_0182416154 /NCGR_PEP_ID=MMETSP1167-20130531/306_1 /TAXON_ID=2988 /ORGANISM="Mallomonas Sp, Strain CCMP3275" /LENGTH=281 /DNA_ID=CAMNT_0024588647 /DNA_START=46 /DNA_END=891 /DNA_ORIENTATION=+
MIHLALFIGLLGLTSSYAAKHIVNKNQPPPKPDVLEEFVNRPGPWDERGLDSLMSSNKKWAERMAVENPAYFETNRLGHSPKILWIGCSDARVPANEILEESAGNVFVHRNIANMVINTDVSCMSVIQYAVDYLKVKHIIVCGHYDCGGVKAALEAADFKSPLENWLRNIRDTFRLHKDEILAIPDKKGRQRRLVELNAVEQAVNVFKVATVQRRRNESRKLEAEIMRYVRGATDVRKLPFTEPQVHAYAYNPATGELTKLDISEHINSHIQELATVYNVY